MSLNEATRRTLGYQDAIRDEDKKIAGSAWKKAFDKLGPVEAPEGFKKLDIQVYACPTPGCPDYFGHTDMPVLETKFTSVMTENRHLVPGDPDRGPGIPPGERHTRAECPSCRSKGLHVERVRVASFVFVPLG